MTALRSDRVGHAYLFSGPRGCGKTTSARILARCLNCAAGPTDTPCGTCDSCVELGRGGGGSLDVVEIDAASHNGVDDARDLRERAIFAPARDRFKIFILDEAHMVTQQGFNALLKLVEEPPAHVKFIFATTEPEKVLGTIRSRTHHYPFRLVPPAAMLEYVQELCETEGVGVEAGVLPLVVRAGGGSPRDTLSLLDQLIAGSDADADGHVLVRYERAVALLGYTHSELLDEVVDAFAANDGGGAFAAVDRVVQTGQDPRRFVDDLLERLRDLIVVAATGAGASAVLRGVPDDELERMSRQATAFGAARLSRTADLVVAALDEMTGATSPRLQLELLVARVLTHAGVAQGTSPAMAHDLEAARGGASAPAPATGRPASPSADIATRGAAPADPAVASPGGSRFASPGIAAPGAASAPVASPGVASPGVASRVSPRRVWRPRVSRRRRSPPPPFRLARFRRRRIADRGVSGADRGARGGIPLRRPRRGGVAGLGPSEAVSAAVAPSRDAAPGRPDTSAEPLPSDDDAPPPFTDDDAPPPFDDDEPMSAPAAAVDRRGQEQPDRASMPGAAVPREPVPPRLVVPARSPPTRPILSTRLPLPRPSPQSATPTPRRRRPQRTPPWARRLATRHRLPRPRRPSPRPPPVRRPTLRRSRLRAPTLRSPRLRPPTPPAPTPRPPTTRLLSNRPRPRLQPPRSVRSSSATCATRGPKCSVSSRSRAGRRGSSSPPPRSPPSRATCSPWRSARPATSRPSRRAPPRAVRAKTSARPSRPSSASGSNTSRASSRTVRAGPEAPVPAGRLVVRRVRRRRTVPPRGPRRPVRVARRPPRRTRRRSPNGPSPRFPHPTVPRRPPSGLPWHRLRRSRSTTSPMKPRPSLLRRCTRAPSCRRARSPPRCPPPTRSTTTTSSPGRRGRGAHPARGRPAHGPAQRGVQRYGEAVVRQMLGATYVRDEPYEPPTRFN